MRRTYTISTLPERLEAARILFEDGASQSEVTRTTGVARETLVKNFPGAGWTKEHKTAQEIGSYGRMIRDARRQGLL